MENQHQHIKGYRDLGPEEIALMNEGKELAEQVGAWLAKLERIGSELAHGATGGPPPPDFRWLSIGRTHLQQGFMAVIRAIAKPTTF